MEVCGTVSDVVSTYRGQSDDVSEVEEDRMLGGMY